MTDPRARAPAAGRRLPRNTLHVVATACLAITVLHAGDAAAQSLSCGGGFFGVGDAKLSVVQRCGEPVFKEAVCVPRPQVVWVPSNYPGAPAQQIVVPQCVPMEDWTYSRGRGSFMSIARFYNGAIESARDGPREP
jgi:hypothetical protein